MAERTLSSSPVMPILYARAGAAMIPGASLLPFVGGGHEIPDLTLVLNDVAMKPDRLATYNDVCGFGARPGDRAALPATYPHMLAFPVHLALMTDSSFPFGAIGLVHIVNRIAQHRPIGIDEQLSFRVWATPLESHPRGRQFSIRTEARVGDELVWEEVSTNLRRGRSDGDGAPGDAHPDAATTIDVPDASDLPAVEDWSLGGDLGRRYGAVSGDLNPIHLHPLTARLFGFSSAIAHGMWTKARCVAALADRLPDAFTIDVAFRKPIMLPATVTFAATAGGDGDAATPRFGVRAAGARAAPHLDGTVTPGTPT
jgi:acyl dehydratase